MAYFLLRVLGSDAITSAVAAISLPLAENFLHRIALCQQARLVQPLLESMTYHQSQCWHYAGYPPWLAAEDPLEDGEVCVIPPPVETEDLKDEVVVSIERTVVTCEGIYWTAVTSSDHIETVLLLRERLEALVEELRAKGKKAPAGNLPGDGGE